MDMKYKVYACKIEVSPDVRIVRDDIADLEDATIGYAVCRYLRKNAALCKQLVMLSYNLRLQDGYKGKAKKFKYIVPACNLDLPAKEAKIYLAVTRKGVIINQIRLA